MKSWFCGLCGNRYAQHPWRIDGKEYCDGCRVTAQQQAYRLAKENDPFLSWLYDKPSEDPQDESNGFSFEESVLLESRGARHQSHGVVRHIERNGTRFNSGYRLPDDWKACESKRDQLEARESLDFIRSALLRDKESRASDRASRLRAKSLSLIALKQARGIHKTAVKTSAKLTRLQVKSEYAIAREYRKLNLEIKRHLKTARDFHGTRNGYQHHGCRCVSCQRANDEGQSRRRKRRYDKRKNSGHCVFCGKLKEPTMFTRCESCRFICAARKRQARAVSRHIEIVLDNNAAPPAE